MQPLRVGVGFSIARHLRIDFFCCESRSVGIDDRRGGGCQGGVLVYQDSSTNQVQGLCGPAIPPFRFQRGRQGLWSWAAGGA